MVTRAQQNQQKAGEEVLGVGGLTNIDYVSKKSNVMSRSSRGSGEFVGKYGSRDVLRSLGVVHRPKHQTL